MVNLGELHRCAYGRLLASLIRMVQDVDLAEDTQQEVFTAAFVQWPVQSSLRHPVAWLLETAQHKAIDQLRRRAPPIFRPSCGLSADRPSLTALVTMSAGLQGRHYGTCLASIQTKRHLGRSCKEP